MVVIDSKGATSHSLLETVSWYNVVVSHGDHLQLSLFVSKLIPKTFSPQTLSRLDPQGLLPLVFYFIDHSLMKTSQKLASEGKNTERRRYDTCFGFIGASTWKKLPFRKFFRRARHRLCKTTSLGPSTVDLYVYQACQNLITPGMMTNVKCIKWRRQISKRPFVQGSRLYLFLTLLKLMCLRVLWLTQTAMSVTRIELFRQGEIPTCRRVWASIALNKGVLCTANEKRYTTPPIFLNWTRIFVVFERKSTTDASVSDIGNHATKQSSSPTWLLVWWVLVWQRADVIFGTAWYGERCESILLKVDVPVQRTKWIGVHCI